MQRRRATAILDHDAMREVCEVANHRAKLLLSAAQFQNALA